MGQYDVTSKPITTRGATEPIQNDGAKNDVTGNVPVKGADPIWQGKNGPRRVATVEQTPPDVVAQKGQQLANGIRLLLSKDTLGPGDCVNINQQLKAATGPELDYALGVMGPFSRTPEAGSLAKLVDRMGATHQDWRNELLGNLASRKDLTVSGKASLLVALEQAGAPSPEARQGNEKAIRELLTGTRGTDLAALKDVIDGSGDFTDLRSLVFGSVEDPKVRGEILAHFKTEGAKLPPQATKVLSDVDDTFYCNLYDSSVPKGTTYPGVKAFYSALESGPGNLQTKPTDLGFLTARPALVGDLTAHTLGKHGVKGEVLLQNPLWHFIGSKNIAAGKTNNFNEYQQLYPERRITFLGDSGQGDPITGAAMLANKDFKGSVYIHDVALDGNPKTSEADRAASPMVYSDTYAGAALAAYRKGDINLEQLVRVSQAVIDETRRVKFDDDGQQQRHQGWLNRDVAGINEALKAAGDARRLQL